MIHENNYVEFVDGSTTKIDSIIVCTGYKHNFRFIDDDIKLKTRDRFVNDGLYKNTVFIKNNNLFYMGMMKQIFPMLYFDVQAHFIRDIILEKILLPTQDGQLKNLLQNQQFEDSQVKYLETEKILHLQADHVKELADLTRYPKPNFNILIENFKNAEKHKFARVDL